MDHLRIADNPRVIASHTKRSVRDGFANQAGFTSFRGHAALQLFEPILHDDDLRQHDLLPLFLGFEREKTLLRLNGAASNAYAGVNSRSRR